MAASTNSDRRGLVTTIMVAAPTNSTKLRSATDTAEPTAALIWVVSAVSRDTISPVFTISKKAAERLVMWANTAARRSATTRSPSVVTR